MVAGVGLLVTAGIGSLIVLLLKIGKSNLRARQWQNRIIGNDIVINNNLLLFL